jgi:hypothetical protein
VLEPQVWAVAALNVARVQPLHTGQLVVLTWTLWGQLTVALTAVLIAIRPAVHALLQPTFSIMNTELLL